MSYTLGPFTPGMDYVPVTLEPFTPKVMCLTIYSQVKVTIKMTRVGKYPDYKIEWSQICRSD